MAFVIIMTCQVTPFLTKQQGDKLMIAMDSQIGAKK
jgi:hypothetical protein